MQNVSTVQISPSTCGSGELDLSQNFLEESSGALELLTLFVEHPKYSKDRPNKVEPVKVDLSHNGNLGWKFFFSEVFSGWESGVLRRKFLRCASRAVHGDLPLI